MKIEDNNILITGGAGFIGTHLAESLAEKNNYDQLKISVIFSSIGLTNEKLRSVSILVVGYFVLLARAVTWGILIYLPNNIFKISFGTLISSMGKRIFG